MSTTGLSKRGCKVAKKLRLVTCGWCLAKQDLFSAQDAYKTTFQHNSEPSIKRTKSDRKEASLDPKLLKSRVDEVAAKAEISERDECPPPPPSPRP